MIISYFKYWSESPHVCMWMHTCAYTQRDLLQYKRRQCIIKYTTLMHLFCYGTLNFGKNVFVFTLQNNQWAFIVELLEVYPSIFKKKMSLVMLIIIIRGIGAQIFFKCINAWIKALGRTRVRFSFFKQEIKSLWERSA